MPAAADAELAAQFAAAMERLGPFEPAPRLAAAVSGGADSMALAWLADDWVRRHGASLLALVVDHGLRAESAQEAELTLRRLAQRGIDGKLLTITGLPRGSALAERARKRRFEVLQAACAEAGILHLLLGHHAGDQAETLMIRALSGSGTAGLSGMASLVELAQVRLLRPLLGVLPARLRALLRGAGVAWVEDPSNADPAALRARLRAGGAARDAGKAVLAEAARFAGERRAGGERAMAGAMARIVDWHPAGFAVLAAGPIMPAALAAVLQTVSGSPYPPPTAAVAALARSPHATTLSGARLLPAGKLGEGMLVVREDAAMAPPVPAAAGAVWDGRFRLAADTQVPAATLGALGTDAGRLRRLSNLPAAVLRTLPAIRLRETLLAVPHLLYPDRQTCECFPVLYSPPRPAAAAPFGFGDA